jgi:hypothetical protein
VRTSTRTRRCGSPRLLGTASSSSWPTCMPTQEAFRFLWSVALRKATHIRPCGMKPQTAQNPGCMPYQRDMQSARQLSNHAPPTLSRSKVPRARAPGSSSTSRWGCAGSSQA